MNARQATLPLDDLLAAAPLAWSDPGHVGFEIGWDHAQHRLTPPVEHLQLGNPLRHGWEAGKAAFGSRTRQATPPVRKWLQLRVNAWQRGRAFETLTVTPAFLRRIEVDLCPITHEPLTHATGTPSDASVDRVNNDAGYAAGNLAVMSVRANQAKAHYAWDDAMAFVRQIEVGQLGAIDGLDASQWARLAVLMSFTTPLPHAQAATLPLLVLPPPRLRLLNAAQCLQAMLTLQFTRDGYTQRIGALTALMPCADTRDAMRGFMHTLLARRIAAGRLGDAAALRRALEDLWRDPLVLRRWQRLALQLTEAQCEHVVQQAQRRGLAGPQQRWLPRDVATDV
ncbi:MAG TPA: hypothetical protein VLJ62_05660, partial [Burkholderiaceae bacterium]|nr:hypothetical protein [Burkholderiaceae bacterium]